jgi:hypothetical protein
MHKASAARGCVPWADVDAAGDSHLLFYFGDGVIAFRSVFSEIGFGVAPLWSVRSNGGGKRVDE